jgi:tRNA G18 (ribose-2'-O)-methylase SpoU
VLQEAIERSKMYNVHDHLKSLTVPELQSVSKKDNLPFGVCLFNIQYDMNFGNIIRSACIMGAERVVVMGKRKIDRRSCVGSQNYIDIVKADGLVEDTIDMNVFVDTMEKFNYYPVFMETGCKPITKFEDTHEYKYPCLVFGSESDGIHPDFLSLPESKSYSIPQRGVIRSLNVASAAAIAMWEVSKHLGEING